MKKINIKKETIMNILEYILVFFIILESNSVFSQLYKLHTIIRISFVGLSSICLVLLLILMKVKINKQFLNFLSFDTIICLILLLNTKSIIGIGIIVLVFLIFLPLLYLYFQNIDRERINNILRKFVNIVIILCCVSLIFYLLSSILDILKPSGTIRILWGKPYSEIETFYYLHFNIQEVYWITGNSIIRNTGIYTEGPMYALIILLALIFNSLIIPSNNKKSYIKSLILAITMITTFSVTGIICTLIAVFNYAINMIKNANKNKRKVLISIMVLIFILALPFGINLIEKKFETNSASHRQTDIINGFNSFIENPIIGKGINHERADELTPEVGYGYSNAIIPIMTDGGILLLFSYLSSSCLLLIHSIKKKKYNYLLFLIIFFILLFTTLFPYRLTMILLLLLQYFIFKKESAEN